MLSPDPIRLGLVVNSCQVGDFFWSYLQPKHLSEVLPDQENCTAGHCSTIYQLLSSSLEIICSQVYNCNALFHKELLEKKNHLKQFDGMNYTPFL